MTMPDPALHVPELLIGDEAPPPEELPEAVGALPPQAARITVATSISIHRMIFAFLFFMTTSYFMQESMYREYIY
jgi:hypothetical protein